MKKFFPLFSAVGILAAVAVVYAVAISVTSDKTGTNANSCTKRGPMHTVTIHEGLVSPQHTAASRCDQLTITNEDNVARLMAFGNHDRHQAYDGVTEELLKHDQSLTVTLNKAGAFTFHDHLHDEVEGSFTVSELQQQ